MSIVCTKCKIEVTANDKFCPKCGGPVFDAEKEYWCDKCHTHLLGYEKYCPYCGSDTNHSKTNLNQDEIIIKKERDKKAFKSYMQIMIILSLGIILINIFNFSIFLLFGSILALVLLFFVSQKYYRRFCSIVTFYNDRVVFDENKRIFKYDEARSMPVNTIDKIEYTFEDDIYTFHPSEYNALNAIKKYQFNLKEPNDKCPNCGNKINSNTFYCVHCGKSLNNPIEILVKDDEVVLIKNDSYFYKTRFEYETSIKEDDKIEKKTIRKYYSDVEKIWIEQYRFKNGSERFKNLKRAITLDKRYNLVIRMNDGEEIKIIMKDEEEAKKYVLQITELIKNGRKI